MVRCSYAHCRASLVFESYSGEDRLAAMGDRVDDGGYEDIILRAITPEYNFIREKRYTDHNFGVDNIWVAMKHTCIHALFRP